MSAFLKETSSHSREGTMTECAAPCPGASEMSRSAQRLLAILLALGSTAGLAQAPDSRFSAGGYYRVSARPDFQGGTGRLGYSPLYGRLMNEGTWAFLEGKLDLLQTPPGSTDTWASLYGRVEGGSAFTADPGNGNLGNFRFNQLYALVGNVLVPNVTWQLGTQRYYFGDLGLFDLRVAEILDEMIGLSGHWHSSHVDVRLALGDSGFAVRGLEYVPLITGGGLVRVHASDSFEVGVGGQFAYEPFISGNRNSSYVTPGIAYEDFLRHEVLKQYLAAHPMDFDRFQLPQAATQASVSWRAVGYVGFGKLGPLRWNSAFARLQRLHPQHSYTDSVADGRSVTVYTADLTRDRYVMQVGDEVQLRLVPDVVDLVVAGLYGANRDYADTISASESNREYMSVVARAQLYLSRTVHFLVEGSAAHERSLNGNLYRSAYDSIFQNAGGVSNTRGLEFGDSAIRNTVQFKTGVVLNPTGPGIYARPSIRLLYGFQYSTQHAAFGNAFVEKLDQFDAFKPTGTVSWHHLVSLESEGWF